MTAEQLIEAAAACADCGEEHTPWPVTGGQTWASKKDGHSYRARIYVMANVSSDDVIAALRQLARECR